MARSQEFYPMNRELFLRAIGECREACIKAVDHGLPLNGPLHQAREKLMDAIDGMPEALPGDRTHFHLKTTPGGIGGINHHPPF